jgi:hypothetical protein
MFGRGFQRFLNQSYEEDHVKRISVLAVTMGLASLFVFPTGARAQFFFVDCTNPLATYPSINYALQFAGPGSFIAVNGPCNESVSVYGANNLVLGAVFGSATLNGNLSITNSHLVFVYGLNVTNPYGDGIDVNSSRSVVFDACSSSGNAGNGLAAGESSDVSIINFGTFNNNGGYGLRSDNNSYVNINSWGGLTDISNNQTAALWVGQGDFATFGNTHMANNAYTSNPGLRVAIDMRGGGKVQIGSVYGPNIIENNPNGGVSLQENAEISLWSIQSSAPNIVRNNGPFGIEAGFGSQVTLAGTQITGHTGPAVDVYAHSQFYGTSQIPGLNATQIQNNATAGGPLNAAIRVDGNSEVLLRGVDISQNHGPAVLALVNSSADVAGGTFTGNTGIITCDSTSTMVSDIPIASRTPASGVACSTAHTLGNRSISIPAPAVPDVTAWKKMHSNYLQRLAAQK